MERKKEGEDWEVVVVQLVERSLPTPEVRGSNPVIGKICMYYQLYWKDENKEKRPGMAQFKKTSKEGTAEATWGNFNKLCWQTWD